MSLTPSLRSDNESGDWHPPPTPPIIESEVFLIPSGLPSLDEFVKLELEAEAAAKAAAEAAAVAAAIEAEDEEHPKEQEEAEAAESIPDEGSIAEQPAAEDEVAVPAADEADDFDMPEAEVKPTKKVAKKAAADDWYEVDVKIDFGDAKAQMEEEAREELRLRLIESTHEYLDNLFNKIVEICEYEDPDEILRTRLNKAKIIKDLDEKLNQLDIEQKIRFFLNRKSVEYFRRKKVTRPLMDDSPDTIVNEMRKYRDGLMMVNKFKGREEELKSQLGAKLADLQAETSILEARAREAGVQLYQMVKKVFNLEGSDKMDSLIDYYMGKVKAMRKEISKVRFVLIQRQHTMATLQEKARKLEDIGDGLHMVDFEHLQTETQALGKKIEERNNELNRLRHRCNADIHALAHIREKQHMLRNTIAAQQSSYDELIEEKQAVREFLNTLKMDRVAIRREFQKISFQNGLLDKPDLLVDYDVAVEKRDVLHAKVTEMRNAQTIIDNKLKHMMRLLQ